MIARVIDGGCVAFLVALLWTACPLDAGTEWSRLFSGPRDEYFVAMEPTPDGGCVAAGSTESFGAQVRDFWVVRVNAAGKILWQKRFGGAGWDHPYAMVVGVDGGILVSGETASFGWGGYDGWIAKLSLSGNIMWQRTYGGWGCEGFEGLIRTRDSGYLALGGTSSKPAGDLDGWVVKLDRRGEILWQKAYGGPEWDHLDAALEMGDGGFMIVGSTMSFGAKECDGWVLRLNSKGDLLWQRRYGTDQYDWLAQIASTQDNGAIVAGGVIVPGSESNDIRMARLDRSGDVVWQKTYARESTDIVGDLLMTEDGRYLVAGSTYVVIGDHRFSQNAWIFSVDAWGNVTWQKRYKYSGEDQFNCVRLLPESGAILAAGFTCRPDNWAETDALIMRLTPSGDLYPSCALSVADTAMTPVETSERTRNSTARAILPQCESLRTNAKPKNTNTTVIDTCK